MGIRFALPPALLALVVACSGSNPTEAVDDAGSGASGGAGGGAGTSASGSGSDAHDLGGNEAPRAGAGLGSTKPRGSIARISLRDPETGESWDAVGRSTSDGDALVPLPGYNQFWFAWSVFNHGSEIFRRGEVSTAELKGDGECAVPCDEIRLGCPGKDCIPALTQPQQVEEGAPGTTYLSDQSWVVGVARNGEARAYPHNVLWWHEIVNDVVGGEPIAVTHCPLTFSSLAFDPTGFIAGETVELGVSGRLFNSNLVFYNRSDDTWFSQLLTRGTKGPALGEPAPRVHVWEMTWGAWKQLHPNSTVLSDETGHARDYTSYPYGSYFGNDASTFSVTSPLPDGTYPNKMLTYGLRLNGAAKAYSHNELAAFAVDEGGADAPPVGVVNDRVGGVDIAVVFDIDAGYVQAFERMGDLELVLGEP